MYIVFIIFPKYKHTTNLRFVCLVCFSPRKPGNVMLTNSYFRKANLWLHDVWNLVNGGGNREALDLPPSQIPVTS